MRETARRAGQGGRRCRQGGRTSLRQERAEFGSLLARLGRHSTAEEYDLTDLGCTRAAGPEPGRSDKTV